jgi:hypothetical protein
LASKHPKRPGRVRNTNRRRPHALLRRSWLYLLLPTLRGKRRRSLSEFERTGGMLDHRISSAKSLFRHAIIARKLLNNASLLKIAKDNFRQWPKDWEHSNWGWWVKEWRNVLKRPTQEICDVICEQSEYALRLRVITPFDDLLTQEELSSIDAAMSIPPIRGKLKNRLGSDKTRRPRKRDARGPVRKSSARGVVESKE